MATAGRKAALRRALGRGKSTWRPIEAPKSLQAAYQKALKGVILDASEAFTLLILPVFEAVPVVADSTGQDLDTAWAMFEDYLTHMKSKDIATAACWSMVNGVKTFHRNQFLKNLKGSIGIDGSALLRDKGVEAIVRRAMADNFELIESLAVGCKDRARTLIYSGLENGADYATIRHGLEEHGLINAGKYAGTDFAVKLRPDVRTQTAVFADFEMYRAKLIARDQTAKFLGAVDSARQTEIGVTHYIWRTSQDERVRPAHEAHNGERFAWSEPPSDTGHPGQDYQCRCTADPDLSGLLGI